MSASIPRTARCRAASSRPANASRTAAEMAASLRNARAYRAAVAGVCGGALAAAAGSLAFDAGAAPCAVFAFALRRRLAVFLPVLWADLDAVAAAEAGAEANAAAEVGVEVVLEVVLEVAFEVAFEGAFELAFEVDAGVPGCS